MIVKKLNWLSEEGQEAELVVSDGTYECVAFCHPCSLSEGGKIQECLYAFDTENLMLSDEKAYLIKQREPEMFEHDCIAQVVDRSKELVRVGDLLIVLDETLPIGCDDRTFVQFSCGRLDVLW
ncbi:MAG: hypothetical protein KBD23_05280 [Gammaproteobacteria bacterium]|nr:hypothetical protein [Gammaproteobacteria bacterium]MBP9729526.1 hypothetical protein [Gammaproteobacteria bacterium]